MGIDSSLRWMEGPSAGCCLGPMVLDSAQKRGRSPTSYVQNTALLCGTFSHADESEKPSTADLNRDHYTFLRFQFKLFHEMAVTDRK